MDLLSPVLRIDNLVKSFGALRAVNDVSLSIGAGEFVALLGPSGSGKSTVFRCVSRLARPDAGSVYLDDQRIDRLEGRRLRLKRRVIGLVFQQFNLIGRLSAIDNVLAGRLGSIGTLRAVLRAFSREDRQLALAALDRVGLLEKAYQRADSLSGGQQQRVAIARVVAQQSRIILADEPVASLDPAAAENVLGLLRSIAHEQGIAVLCSLHQTDLARRFADRVVAMKDGRVVLDAPTAALGKEQLTAIYGRGSPPAVRVSVPAKAALIA
ncbi:phosphonate ABC transporter ATP-binding protein [Pseudolabrys sp. FHR47]|uniref:phosphonate ABC transporter ATP-binding protein n=1 Tax=Pseudolabrys sp. FHR47 TaxID=2562284 RepID=UPI0010BF1756|nr:phosphonate ABC transporter ATP-binding protein [Pseudolabrys sp. FHR47]